MALEAVEIHATLLPITPEVVGERGQTISRLPRVLTTLRSAATLVLPIEAAVEEVLATTGTETPLLPFTPNRPNPHPPHHTIESTCLHGKDTTL